MKKRLPTFIFLSLLYWWAGLTFAGGLAYGSICHYPEIPGCNDDFTLPIVAGLALIGGYVAICWAFARYVRRKSESD